MGRYKSNNLLSKEDISSAIDEFKSIGKAAEALGINRGALYYAMERRNKLEREVRIALRSKNKTMLETSVPEWVETDDGFGKYKADLVIVDETVGACPYEWGSYAQERPKFNVTIMSGII